MEEFSNLKYYNEYGGFSEDGKEYIIRTNKNNKLQTVWSNILANKNFGTVVTENMGGYTWHKNARLNRITAWNNSASSNIPSEIIYLKDEEKDISWSIAQDPMPDENEYKIVYGFGYAKYIHESLNLMQEAEVFVPEEDCCKIYILRLKNLEPVKKNLKIYYYIKPVIGEDEIKTYGYIESKLESENNLVRIRNLYNRENLSQNVFVTSSEKIKNFTGEKREFVGFGGISNPDELKKEKLKESDGLGKEAAIVIAINVSLNSFESKEISLCLGVTEENYIELAKKYSNVQNCKLELENVKRFWRDKLERLQVETPLESLNIMLNGWVMYQALVSRLYARSGFYQSGGAFGFRDQLQDSLATKFINPDILKQQILYHSSHQFQEGDVEHWWHEETARGIRTRFSDDLLWLVFCTIEYINFTNDYSILDIQTPYLIGRELKENEEDKYDKWEQTQNSENIFNHCIKAIKRSFNFGEHGFPKIGTGDWNDGFSEVGSKGKGESVWLGFFMYYILDNFIPICEEWSKICSNKLENEAEIMLIIHELNDVKNKLKRTLNSAGWDGRWYKRAFCDDGQVLGTIENEECKIDSISQSWSVISNAGDNDKKYICMESLENNLIDMENGIIKLLTPPFEKSKLEPGYIKAYLPGVRENGGQYTHEYCSCGHFWSNSLEIKTK
ncbi:MAG: hypothetical protein IJV31_09590 [Clostridia bacterium]|nr:hypothetical protein [Clostridia bacterium]